MNGQVFLGCLDVCAVRSCFLSCTLRISLCEHRKSFLVTVNRRNHHHHHQQHNRATNHNVRDDLRVRRFLFEGIELRDAQLFLAGLPQLLLLLFLQLALANADAKATRSSAKAAQVDCT